MPQRARSHDHDEIARAYPGDVAEAPAAGVSTASPHVGRFPVLVVDRLVPNGPLQSRLAWEPTAGLIRDGVSRSEDPIVTAHRISRT